MQEKICNSFGYYTRGKHFQSHFAFVDQPFFFFSKLRQKEEKEKEKEREKRNQVFFDGWFSIHKSFDLKKKKVVKMAIFLYLIFIKKPQIYKDD